MTGDTGRPWRAMYADAVDDPPRLDDPSALAAFRDVVARSPEVTLITYFDTAFSAERIDGMSDALAADLGDRGLGPGDRIATFLQNMPQYVIALLASWKLGAALVPLNPMLRANELEHQLTDSGAKALISLATLWDEVARGVVASTQVDVVVTTTGTPKGAMASHGNVAAIGQIFGNWVELDDRSVVLALAPLFHITGLMCQLVPCLMAPATLVLGYRYHAEVMLEMIREQRPTFAVGPVTAFIGLVQARSFRPDDFASFERIHSGGAPVSPATSAEFERLTGHPLLGAYGMTEATAATHLAPKGVTVPVDPVHGALAVGIPIPGVTCTIVDDDGNEVPAGTPGEVVLQSPGVVSGYWQRPDDSRRTIRDGRLYSGDFGVMDQQGWLFLVDRKKDLIICSGFKVWPREVEDVLYEHPAVKEAAVVGVPDDYRGESVKAVVSLREGHQATPEELMSFAGTRLAAYKRPQTIEIVTELPKTVSGKILRRSLRGASLKA